MNSCGAAALALFRTCYPVHRIFRRKVADNARKFSPSDLMGWKMTGRSKAEAVGGATTYWKQGLCIVRNKNTLRELEVFVKKSTRMLPEAMEGTDPITGERYHDDEVTAFVLAIFASRQLPFRGRMLVDAAAQEERECLHAVIAGAKCLKCRKEFPEAKEEPLTFEALRKMVKTRQGQSGNRRHAAMSDFWTGGWDAIR